MLCFLHPAFVFFYFNIKSMFQRWLLFCREQLLLFFSISSVHSAPFSLVSQLVLWPPYVTSAWHWRYSPIWINAKTHLIKVENFQPHLSFFPGSFSNCNVKLVVESNCPCVSSADWHPHPCQEKEGGAEQRVGCHEESGCQKRLNCCLIKLKEDKIVKCLILLFHQSKCFHCRRLTLITSDLGSPQRPSCPPVSPLSTIKDQWVVAGGGTYRSWQGRRKITINICNYAVNYSIVK